MKVKILIILNVFVLLLVSTILIYNSYIAEEPNYSITSKGVMILVSYLVVILGIGRKRSAIELKVYEEKYKELIEGTFSEDEKSYREMLQVLIHCNHKKYKKAHKLLDKLQEKCMCDKDYAAVYFLRASCLQNEKKTDRAIAVYEKLLQYDVSNSDAWSNVGILYFEKGKTKEAIEAYTNAILYNSNNDYAYNNRADNYLRMGEVRLALKDALQALEINPNMYQAMATAAIAYKVLGDDANAEKYYKMYGINGDDPKNLESVMTILSRERKES